ncbi:MAG: dimethylsulfoniopropionate demethylase [Gemmatimonadetes bacterium]|nr:dimethylsulfoniopropionate demethylase [Gemmatimonadota bacterium]
MMSSVPGLAISRRIRRTPFTERIESLGVKGYSIVNHTLLPKAFESSNEEVYWHLREHVQLWDVSCQRQVEIRGPDAAKLVQLMTPRDLRQAKIGHCLYISLIDNNAGIINDPILLKLEEDHFWLSIADSDVLLWAKGLSLGCGFDVMVDEPDVSPLAVQGPKAELLMEKVFGTIVRKIRFFQFNTVDFKGNPLQVSRTGYSRQGGFEIYLDKSSLGIDLWDTLWKAGQEFNVAPGYPNLVERVEGGLLSYGNEMTRANNPLECNLDHNCCLDGSLNYIGREALQKIAETGPTQRIRGVIFEGEPTPPCASPWPIMADGKQVGYTTTVVWSLQLKKNLSLAMIDAEFWNAGQNVQVETPDGLKMNGTVVEFPLSVL